MILNIAFRPKDLIQYILLFLLTIQVVYPQEVAHLLTDQKGPFKKNIRIEVDDTVGNKGFLPVSIFRGKSEGPVFTIVAGVHGFEYPPIMATQQLMQEIDVNKLTGTIIFIPIASRGSFYNREPFKNPEDSVNLNNAFPGNQKGTITQRTAHIITKEIITVSDIFLDIHGGMRLKI